MTPIFPKAICFFLTLLPSQGVSGYTLEKAGESIPVVQVPIYFVGLLSLIGFSLLPDLENPVIGLE